MLKPAPIYLLVNGETDGPHEAAEIVKRMSDVDEEDENPLPPLSGSTLSCIEGMKGWRCLDDTLFYAYAKLLPALPQAGEWIAKMVGSRLNLRDGNMTIRKTLLRTAKLDDWSAPDYLWPVIDTNADLLRSWQDYVRRAQYWNIDAMQEYPVMEFVPLSHTRSAADWINEWAAAGGVSHQGRMMARKDDPCWRRFSDFGLPFSPFCFGRAGYLIDVALEEANRLGFDFDRRAIELPELPPFKIVGAD